MLYEINTRRTPIRRVEDNNVNEEIPPQVEQVEQFLQGAQGGTKYQVPIVEEGNDVPVNPPEMTSGEIKEAFLILARDLTTHMNRCIERRVNIVERTMTLRLRDFVRIHPPIFLGPKVGENPQ